MTKAAKKKEGSPSSSSPPASEGGSNGSVKKADVKAKPSSGRGGFCSALGRIFMTGVIIAAFAGLIAIIVALNERESSLRVQVAELKGEITTAQSDKKLDQEEILKFRKKVLSLEKDNADFRAIEVQHEKAMTQLTADVKKLISENENLARENNEQLFRLKDDVSSRDTSLNEARNQIVTLTNKLTQAELQVQDLTDNKGVLTQRIKDITDESLSLRETIDILKNQMDVISEGASQEKGQAEGLSAQLENVVNERNQLQKSVDEARAIIKAKEESNARIQSDVESKTKEIEEKEALLRNAQEQIQALTERVEGQNLKMDSFEKEKGKYDNNVQVLRDEITAQTNEITSLKGQIDGHITGAEEMKSLNEKCTKEAEELERLLRSEQEKIGPLSEEIDSLRQEKESVSSRLASFEEQAVVIQSDLDNVKKNNEALVTEKEKLLSQLSLLQNEATAFRELSDVTFSNVAISAIKSSAENPVPDISAKNLANICKAANILSKENEKLCVGIGKGFVTLNGDGVCREG